jgi:hypothetical protein
MIGENRRFMSALITFKAEMDMTTGLPSEKLLPETVDFFKKTLKINVKDTHETVKNPEVIKYVEKCMEQTNQMSVSKATHIKKFELLAIDFS